MGVDHQIDGLHLGVVTQPQALTVLASATQQILSTGVHHDRPEKVIYTAKVHTTGGRVGSPRNDDGKLDVKLSRPGTSGEGANPA
jgi:organic hydroperoxide reductase OsmC/OhrA